MTRVRFLVVGAGVTGLSFVQHLDDPDYWICEAEPEIGGYCRTVRQDGFVWDYSGHFFHFRHPELEARLVERIGASRVRKVVKASSIHYRGQLIDFPFQRNIHQLPREEFLECLVDLYEAHEQESSAPAPASFEEMLYAKFGRGISEKFLIPYNRKLYATELSTLDVDAMGRFFPHARLDEILRGFRGGAGSSYNATFTYPEGGAIEYVRAIAQDVDQAKLSLSEPVLRIDLREKVADTHRRSIAFEHLVSTMPLPRLLALTGLAHDPSLYTCNQVLVFNLGFDAKGPRGVHWLYFPDPELVFYRVGFYDNIFESERMSLYVELGMPSHRRLDGDQVAALREQTLRDLARVGVLGTQRLVASHHVVMNPAYVHITKASLQDTARQKARLATRGVYSLGRYGSWTYCSIEDNMVEARALAEDFNAAMAASAPAPDGG